MNALNLLKSAKYVGIAGSFWLGGKGPSSRRVESDVMEATLRRALRIAAIDALTFVLRQHSGSLTDGDTVPRPFQD
jgi:hypothetical protein